MLPYDMSGIGFRLCWTAAFGFDGTIVAFYTFNTVIKQRITKNKILFMLIKTLLDLVYHQMDDE